MKLRKIINIVNMIQMIFLIYILYLIISLESISILIKIIICLGILAIGMALILGISKFLKRKKTVAALLLSILFIILYGALFVGLHFYSSFESLIDKITSDKYMEVNSSFIVLKTSNIETLEDLDEKEVGLLTNKNDYEGYIMPTEAIEEANITPNITYVTSYLELINGLLDEEYDAIVLPKDYKERFEFTEEFEENFENFVSVHDMSDKVKITANKEEEAVNSKDPFNILLIGTDSELETHHHNYDVVILLTFNPKTNDLVVTSVYRAAAMYSSCIGGVDLVTHNGWKGWGPECLKQTVEDFFDIDISHYIMIDFGGFVDLVDELGGITADVPKSFCEQDSERRWGSHTICLEAGKQELNGEEALALARHRKSYKGNGGEIRSQNHITVIKAIAQKMIGTDLLFKFNDILSIVQSNTETDMSKEQLYSFYNTALEIAKNNDYNLDKISIISHSFDGDPDTYYSPALNSAVGMEIIYEGSYNNIYNSLQAVLYNKPKNPTYYSFDLSEDPDYIEEVIMSEIRDQIHDPRIVANLVGKTESEALKYEKKYYAFNIIFQYQYSDTVAKGIVISQSIPAGEGFKNRNKMTVVISKGSSTPIVEEDTTEEDTEGETTE